MSAISFQSRRRSAVFCSWLLLLSAGCGDGLNLAAVTGQVTKGGQPQPKMWVEFTPVGGGRPAEGRTDQEGRYELSYSGTEKGAKIGQHRVRIMSGGEVDGRDNELSPRKQVLTSEVEVVSGSNEHNFEIP
jgi:hypothetical protein